jgi:hypothetical protein
MMNNLIASHQFAPGENAISIVSHPPEIHPGTLVNIVKPWHGNLCAVKLPNGEIHRWFAWFELRPQNPYSGNPLDPGSYAIVIESTGHGKPPHILVGTTVRIVRCIPTTFYDLKLNNGEYHRWLAEFELAKPI